VVGTLASIFALIYTLWSPHTLTEYHLSVRTEDEERTSADAKVETSVKSIINGSGHLWNIEIQSSNLPSDRKVRVSAENKDAFLQGQKEVTLGEEPNPSVTLVMTRDRSARAFGRVIDKEQTPIAGALVYVIGHENEVVYTGDKGQFELPAHAAYGETIHVHVEKNWYEPEDVVNFAGIEPVPILLSRRRR